MPKKTIKLNGIFSDLKNLTGIDFKFIPASGEIDLPACSGRKICKAVDFATQRNRCRDIEISAINKSKKPDFKISRFRCGLSEFILPVFNNGNLHGVILTNKIKGKNNFLNLANDSTLPILNSKQMISFASLLNYFRMHFKEIVSSHQDAIPNTKDRIIIDRAKNFIAKNYHHSRIPLKDLAKEIHTSYFSLCRLFKKELNLNFTQYLTLVRLNAALRLLQNRNLTIAQVSYAVGFSDAQYFDRVFKKILNCTPKEYRFSAISKREKIGQKVLSQLF